MTLALGIVAFFAILAVLILIHESGHFATAKLFGVRVQEFGLGFPPRLKSWRRGETVYSLNLIPLGGFVKMLGENGEADEPDSFGSHPQWQRFVVLAAGPVMNIGLAILIFFFLFMAGAPKTLPVTVVASVSPHSPAAVAGLQPGDRIVALDGHRVESIQALRVAEAAHRGQIVTVTYVRRHTTQEAAVHLRLHPRPNQGAMGVLLGRTVVQSYGPLRSAHMALGEVGAMVSSLPLIVQSVGQHGASQVTGPIGIAHITTEVVGSEPSTGPGSILQFMAFLSANLGVLNLLPIPALDGGRLVFVIVSWIRRRNLDPQVEGMIHLVGMAVLLFLILLVSYQDLVRWVGGSSY